MYGYMVVAALGDKTELLTGLLPTLAEAEGFRDLWHKAKPDDAERIKIAGLYDLADL